MLAKDAAACTERSMPPSMMTNVRPAARRKSTEASAITTDAVSRLANPASAILTPVVSRTSNKRGVKGRIRSPRLTWTPSAVAKLVTSFSPLSRSICLGRSHHMLQQRDLGRLRIGRRIEASGDLAVTHDENGMAKPDGLLQRVRGQHDRNAFSRQVADHIVDLFLRADIETAGRMVENQDARMGG